MMPRAAARATRSAPAWSRPRGAPRLRPTRTRGATRRGQRRAVHGRPGSEHQRARGRRAPGAVTVSPRAARGEGWSRRHTGWPTESGAACMSRRGKSGQSGPRRRVQHKPRARLIRLAAPHPDLALGCDAAVGWRREAPTQMPAWSAGAPVRLVAPTGPAQDPAGQARAGDGLSGPTTHHRR
jgi:hypothetical protein